jgi:hypothetical protein
MILILPHISSIFVDIWVIGYLEKCWLIDFCRWILICWLIDFRRWVLTLLGNLFLSLDSELLVY